ncbi:MAG: hypothetical protein AABZ14_07230 [Candidatus Margulisiibacteriota bacterium]|mgnify:CR=1 FL=1
MDTTISQKQSVIRQPEYVRVVDWDSAILIKRAVENKIPTNQELLLSLAAHKEQSLILSSELVERSLDKLIHLYFHYLIEEDMRVKDHFYSGYIKLVTELTKHGLNIGEFRMVREIAQAKRKQLDRILSLIEEKAGEEKGMLLYREISRNYQNFRYEHTAYGEHISPLLTVMTRNWSVQFY